jgi:3-deoxy-D-manno-octulosonate 8-phosphate phosphatase (KDO 8-P phosphatase)
VPEARPEVLQVAQFVSRRSGGFGAVRDVIEELLKARGVWQQVVDKDGRP